MKLKTFYKAMISAGVFLLFCTFPGADVKAGDTAENIYCNISYEYVIKSADGTTALADGDEKARLDNQNSANPTSYDPEYEATKEELKLQAFDTERYYDFKGWYETQEKAEEGKERKPTRSGPFPVISQRKIKTKILHFMPDSKRLFITSHTYWIPGTPRTPVRTPTKWVPTGTTRGIRLLIPRKMLTQKN